MPSVQMNVSQTKHETLSCIVAEHTKVKAKY